MSWPRVLSTAADHPYVDRLDGRVARLVGRAQPADAARPGTLDPDWIGANALDWDIAHLHLGLDDPDPLRLGGPERRPEGLAAGWAASAGPVGRAAAVAEAVEAHRRAGVPVVITVHAVAVPDDPAGDHLVGLLRSISPAVAAVLTLTRGCAEHLQGRIDRPVRAIPHGPLVDAATRSRLRAHRRRLTGTTPPLLLHAGSVPPDLLWRDVLAAVDRSDEARELRVLVHADRADEVARAAVGRSRVTVVPHRGLTRRRLERAVADAGALVLADRRGCHSTLLELAADVGTPVIATDVGWRCQQQPAIPVPVVDGHIDVDALAAAIDAPLPTRPMVRECERERDDHAFRSHHQRLYHRLLMGRTVDVLLAGDDDVLHRVTGDLSIDVDDLSDDLSDDRDASGGDDLLAGSGR